MFEAESRRIQLAAFRQTMNERIGSLNAGESVNGEEVTARFIAEMDEPGPFLHTMSRFLTARHESALSPSSLLVED